MNILFILISMKTDSDILARADSAPRRPRVAVAAEAAEDVGGAVQRLQLELRVGGGAQDVDVEESRAGLAQGAADQGDAPLVPAGHDVQPEVQRRLDAHRPRA